MSQGRIRNPLHLSKEWMSETLMPTVARASALPDGREGSAPKFITLRMPRPLFWSKAVWG